MDKAAFQSRLGALVVNARVAFGERPNRESVLLTPISILVAELKQKNLWDAFSDKYDVVEAGDGSFWDPIGQIV